MELRIGEGLGEIHQGARKDGGKRRSIGTGEGKKKKRRKKRLKPEE